MFYGYFASHNRIAHGSAGRVWGKDFLTGEKSECQVYVPVNVAHSLKLRLIV